MEKYDIIKYLRFLTGIAVSDKSITPDQMQEIYTAVDEAVEAVKNSAKGATHAEVH